MEEAMTGDNGIRNELRIAHLIAPENIQSPVIPGFGEWNKDYETMTDTPVAPSTT